MWKICYSPNYSFLLIYKRKTQITWLICRRKLLYSLNNLCTPKWEFPLMTQRWQKAICSWSFVHRHFLRKNLNAVCTDYLIIFQEFLRIFFATFFKSRLHNTYFNFLKLTKKHFILPSEIKKAQYKIKNIYMWHTQLKTFLFTLPKKWHWNNLS